MHIVDVQVVATDMVDFDDPCSLGIDLDAVLVVGAEHDGFTVLEPDAVLVA